jgi:hypothetical protein
MYAAGRGVAKDEAMAVKWFLKAAAQDDRSAQFNLGLMYDQGRGVDVDGAKAGMWFRKAAENGLPEAQVVLGNAYAHGKGLLQDLTQACFWLSMAKPDFETPESTRDEACSGLDSEQKKSVSVQIANSTTKLKRQDSEQNP